MLFRQLGFVSQNRPKIGPEIAKNEVNKLTHFLIWAPFRVNFRSRFGAKEGHDVPRWSQEGPQEQYRKTAIAKSVILPGRNHTF